ncbi:hypothetical protein HKBW3S42_02355, partial [Candidatus Hakubella thermalkaliphila]
MTSDLGNEGEKGKTGKGTGKKKEVNHEKKHKKEK